MSSSEVPQDRSRVSVSDETIVNAVVSGSVDRFGELIERHRPMIFALLMRLTGDRELADEISHESFIKAFHHLKQFKFGSRFSTWLTRIALNHVSTFFSSRRYLEQVATEPFELEKHEMNIPSPIPTDEHEARLRLFRSSIATLDEKYRSVIVLCGLEAKSYAECAEILDIFHVFSHTPRGKI